MSDVNYFRVGASLFARGDYFVNPKSKVLYRVISLNNKFILCPIGNDQKQDIFLSIQENEAVAMEYEEFRPMIENDELVLVQDMVLNLEIKPNNFKNTSQKTQFCPILPQTKED